MTTRRDFLRGASASAALLAMSGTQAGASGERITMTQKRQEAMTPDQALAELQAGNERFVAGTPRAGDLKAQVKQTAAGQFPFASILGCVDSRVSPELVFDQGIGDVFTARIAGNFTDTDLTGSLEFTTKVVGSKLILVVGHSQCGAVRGAIDGVEMGNLTSTLSNIQPAVKAARGMPGSDKETPDQFQQRVAEVNVDLTVKKLLSQSRILSDLVSAGKLKVKGAMYSVETGRVTFRG